MQSLLSLKGLVSSVLLASLATAVPTVDLKPRQSTCNTATDRACWSSGFDITTDYETATPEGATADAPVTYTLEVTEAYNWTGPDGIVKDYVQLINNQFPGPTLFANWGDNITITVTNNLPLNGTSFHWHGLRQFETNIQDGVNGVTECPLAPGKSKVYKLRATQYGTTWYHSHNSIQYGNGVWGTFHIDGPASANYDIDLGVYPITDYYYRGADDILPDTTKGGPPASDNILFNGTNINPLATGLGAYDIVTLTPGSVHRLRLINPSVENNFQVTLVGHNLTVIATDLVPVEPLTVDTLYMGIGQRYDVLIDASQAVDSYWFNVTFATGAALGLCGTSNNPQPASIFRYEGATDANPTNPGTAPVSAECQDRIDFVPVVVRTADETGLLSDAADPAHNQAVALNFTVPFTWTINGSAINVDWDRPVLTYVIEGNTSYPRDENLIFTNEDDGVWTYWVIQNTSPLPHPMHLHGHDFLVLGSGDGTFATTDADAFNFANPTRRDVTMLRPNGYLVLAFRADNPGNWLFHCHIAWHVSGGLSADFMERPDEQLALISSDDLADYQQVCQWWDDYVPSAPAKPDSGL